MTGSRFITINAFIQTVKRGTSKNSQASHEIDLKGQSHSRSRTNHSQITHRLGLCVLVRREIDQIFGVSGTEIIDESRINHP